MYSVMRLLDASVFGAELCVDDKPFKITKCQKMFSKEMLVKFAFGWAEACRSVAFELFFGFPGR